jgi:hypothetical protein
MALLSPEDTRDFSRRPPTQISMLPEKILRLFIVGWGFRLLPVEISIIIGVADLALWREAGLTLFSTRRLKRHLQSSQNAGSEYINSASMNI